ncbi:MAG: 3-hydroxyacyl-CoA dehydrogenase [Porticoccaceae bacterium]|nr:MAG: 3-hydroxyacyl-CoA dehydrogenase [Porticoccaceae bacterium]
MSETFNGFHYEKGDDGIVLVTMDMAGPVNAMNADFRAAMAWLADRLEAEEDLAGVILASAKETFFAGGDLKELIAAERGQEGELFATFEALKQCMRRIERLPVPVVAAINGAALGGGLELALIANHRIAWDHPKVVLGFPEVTLGLLPGAGGIVRTLHKIGLERALPLLLEGRRFTAREGVELGLVDELVESREALVSAAREWIRRHPGAGVKPWDLKGYRLLPSPATVTLLHQANARYFARHHDTLPAPARILSVAHDVYCVDFDTALRIETRGLVELLMTTEAKNLITANFFHYNRVRSGASRPAGVERRRFARVGVVGAGTMGRAIAALCARAGVEVVLHDRRAEACTEARAHLEALLAKGFARAGDEEARRRLLARLSSTAEGADLAACDLFVEAVDEDLEAKRAVLAELEPLLGPERPLLSNSSSLPVSLIGQGSRAASWLVGAHFFYPAEKMALVEVSAAEETDSRAVAAAFDLARQLDKLPILISARPGLFTTRVFCTYLDEGCRLLLEGIEPAFIENVGRLVGMPRGPLAIHDEVGQRLIRRIVQPPAEARSPADLAAVAQVAARWVSEFGRGGRGHGGGFYDYDEAGARLWPRLRELYRRPGAAIAPEEAKDRLLFRQVVETLRCLEEGVLRSVPEGNVGSLLGIGAPAWTGGFIQFVNGYGPARFATRCAELADRYGPRFAVPSIALAAAEAGRGIQ